MNTLKILLSTYNGEKYLKQQLDSLFSQTYKNFEIIARDDGSQDKTLEILQSYKISIIDSKKNLGAKGSFGELLEYAVQNSDADYFIFCDQDDVWEDDKIEKTLAKMYEMEIKYPDMPLLVHSDLKVVDEKLNIIDNSFWKYEHIKPKVNGLNKLLMQNTITGCTVMINKKLADLALPIPSDSIMHDWWLGLVASKFGKIGYLDEATMLYRQHGNNDTGAKKYNLSYIANKFKQLKNINLNKNMLQAKVFLTRFREQLDNDTIIMLEEFIDIKNKSFVKKRKILIEHKLFKQGFIRNVGVMVTI